MYEISMKCPWKTYTFYGQKTSSDNGLTPTGYPLLPPPTHLSITHQPPIICLL